MIPFCYLFKKFTIELLITLSLDAYLGSWKDSNWNLYCELNINKIRRNKFLLPFRAPNRPCE